MRDGAGWQAGCLWNFCTPLSSRSRACSVVEGEFEVDESIQLMTRNVYRVSKLWIAHCSLMMGL